MTELDEPCVYIISNVHASKKKSNDDKQLIEAPQSYKNSQEAPITKRSSIEAPINKPISV